MLTGEALMVEEGVQIHSQAAAVGLVMVAGEEVFVVVEEGVLLRC